MNLMISIHALREEGDLSRTSRIRRTEYFYPRPPRGGRPRRKCCFKCVSGISIHALREEGDVEVDVGVRSRNEFLSTPSARRATAALCIPSRGLSISIHALREEGDVYPAPVGRND